MFFRATEYIAHPFFKLELHSGKGIGNENKNEESHVEEVVESIFALFRCHPTSVPVLAALHSALSALTPRTPLSVENPLPDHAQFKLVGSGITGSEAYIGERDALSPISGLHQISLFRRLLKVMVLPQSKRS